jgi:hypothetical protein
MREISQVVADCFKFGGLPERKLQPDRWQCPVELMPGLMQRLGLREHLREAEVLDAWSKIVSDFHRRASNYQSRYAREFYMSESSNPRFTTNSSKSRSSNPTKDKPRFGAKPYATSASAWADVSNNH